MYNRGMGKEIQISAVVSETTRDLLEQYSRSTGVKKGYLVEEALRHFLVALQELPRDVIIHPKIVVSLESGMKILDRINNPRPTAALRELLRGGNKTA